MVSKGLGPDNSLTLTVFIVSVFTVILLHLIALPVNADVHVYDMVAVQGEEVRFKAETRGTLFTRGGEIVEFFVDDVSLGKNLSGGDGAAYRFYRASRAGLLDIRAVSRNKTGRATLLVVKRGAGIVAVDVEGPLLRGGSCPRDARAAGRRWIRLQNEFPSSISRRGRRTCGRSAHGSRRTNMPMRPCFPGTAATCSMTSRRRA